MMLLAFYPCFFELSNPSPDLRVIRLQELHGIPRNRLSREHFFASPSLGCQRNPTGTWARSPSPSCGIARRVSTEDFLFTTWDMGDSYAALRRRFSGYRDHCRRVWIWWNC